MAGTTSVPITGAVSAKPGERANPINADGVGTDATVRGKLYAFDLVTGGEPNTFGRRCFGIEADGYGQYIEKRLMPIIGGYDDLGYFLRGWAGANTDGGLPIDAPMSLDADDQGELVDAIRASGVRRIVLYTGAMDYARYAPVTRRGLAGWLRRSTAIYGELAKYVDVVAVADGWSTEANLDPRLPVNLWLRYVQDRGARAFVEQAPTRGKLFEMFSKQLPGVGVVSAVEEQLRQAVRKFGDGIVSEHVTLDEVRQLGREVIILMDAPVMNTPLAKVKIGDTVMLARVESKARASGKASAIPVALPDGGALTARAMVIGDDTGEKAIASGFSVARYFGEFAPRPRV